MIYVVYTTLLFAGLFAIQEGYRRAPKPLTGLLLLATIGLSLLWYGQGYGPFIWAKTFSVLAGVLIFTWLRSRKGGVHRAGQIALYLVLVLNILEAVAMDAVAGRPENILSALAGVVLILTCPSSKDIGRDEGDRGDVVWTSMTPAWFVGYTLWNLSFLYNNVWHRFIIDHVALLGAALLAGILKPPRWLEARAVTLLAYALFQNSTWNLPLFKPFDFATAHPTARMAFASLSLAFMLFVAFRTYGARGRAPGSTEPSATPQVGA